MLFLNSTLTQGTIISKHHYKKFVTTGMQWNFTAPLLQSRIRETVLLRRGQLRLGAEKPFFNGTYVFTISYVSLLGCHSLEHINWCLFADKTLKDNKR